ncbi:MAG TPA: alpha/beta fold hydrolase, partial [Euzebya sp.]|nr:alpha/beta fold hydrolase [Euzebya sp.]
MCDTGQPDGAAGLPVVLLHGWTGSKEDFDRIIAALASRRRVVAPDLPGHGGTAPASDGDYSLPAHVRFLQQLLDDLDLG